MTTIHCNICECPNNDGIIEGTCQRTDMVMGWEALEKYPAVVSLSCPSLVNGEVK